MSDILEVKVPDIGDFDAVDVIEVLVSVGDVVEVDQSLITLESDKASMEVPSPVAGTVKSLEVAVGDQVAEGALVAKIEVTEASGEEEEAEEASESQAAEADDAGDESAQPGAAKEEAGPQETGRQAQEEETASSSEESKAESTREESKEATSPRPAPTAELAGGGSGGTGKVPPHASPSVRRFARELGVDLVGVEGTGRKGRILKEDVQKFVKGVLSGASPAPAAASGAAAGTGIPAVPAVDFSKFGPIEEIELSRIRRASGRNISRSWLNVPHVTQFDEADITEMEAFRKSQQDAAARRGVKLTPLAFLMKAAVAALKEFPDFNSSLHPSGEKLIRKGYFHLGIAVDTPKGLVVPVIRDVDQKGLFDLAGELGEVSQRARDGKLTPTDIQGAGFSISSLGGIGGTNFTPIVNAPEVAILGVARSKWQPVHQDGEFVPRLILPFSVSYDHRVIDGAAGARFTGFLSRVLEDLRQLLL